MEGGYIEKRGGDRMKHPWHWMRSHIWKLIREDDRRGDSSGTTLFVGKTDSTIEAAPPGWRVLTAANLDEAQSLLARQEIPVVFCDRDFPGVDWKRAIRLLAGSRSHPSVVLLTSAGRPPGWDEVAAAGGYDILREPVTVEVLERTLRSARSHWRSRRALESESRRGL